MKRYVLWLLLPIGFFSCQKGNRSITYNVYPHAGYAVTAVATFTENKDKTEVVLAISNLSVDTPYNAHIHQGDTSTYGSAPILLHFDDFTATAPTHTLSKTWDVKFDDVDDFNGCIAIHNPYTGVALGNIGSNAK